MGEHYCVGRKSSIYSKGMMLGKCWTELGKVNLCNQLGFVVCTFRLFSWKES